MLIETNTAYLVSDQYSPAGRLLWAAVDRGLRLSSGGLYREPGTACL